MKFLVEIPDEEVLLVFPKRSAELARLDIRDALDSGSCFIDVKVTIFPDGAA